MASSDSATGAVGGGYGLGFIGALIYMMQQAHSFWNVLQGIFIAIFWPAYLVYHLFSFLRI